ncbi:MAG: pyridoxamine 5'-phosphate oxidase family protein [Acidimicrobiales bacterium]
MASWASFEEAEPEFAAKVKAAFESGRHKILATLRADGSPRISGIECEFVDGVLRFGSMPGSRKGADLRRDPRFALHGPPSHPEQGLENEWIGEAKVSGLARPGGDITTDEAPGEVMGEWFHADIEQVVFTGLNADATMLSIQTWTPQGGLNTIERA